MDDFDIAPAATVMPELILQVADETEEELDEDDGEDEDEETEDKDDNERRKKVFEPKRAKLEQTQKQVPRLPKRIARGHRSAARQKVVQPTPMLPGGKVVSGTGNSKKLLCSLCGRTYTGLTAYNRHQLIHAGLKPHKCEVCGKSFTQGQRLTTHMRIHTGEKPYQCHFCPKRFGTKSKSD